MRKAFPVILVVTLFFLVALPGVGMCRHGVNMYDLLSDAKEVNVYVGDISDSSGQAGDVIPGLRKKLENVLETRMTINFVPVPEKKNADLVIGCEIVECIWLKEDPIDEISGSVSIAYDVVMKENYARLQAVFTVKRGPEKILLFKRRGGLFRGRKSLWEEKLQATVTRKQMSKTESRPLLEDRILKVFMRKCFSKNAKPISGR
ncbi:MAG: hypothetical protein U9R44_05520 [Candidatus Omnitrophota bacterium]|nr:hypothetical protein [Candidatus Omnitrophota bacterium]